MRIEATSSFVVVAMVSLMQHIIASSSLRQMRVEQMDSYISINTRQKWEVSICNASLSQRSQSTSSATPPSSTSSSATSSTTTNTSSSSLPPPPRPTSKPRYYSKKKLLIPARVGKFIPVREMPSIRRVPGFGKTFIAWGLPMLGFILGGAWVVAQALEGRTKEFETSKGVSTISQRKAAVQEQQEEMMKRIDKIVKTDFDNTKRIERPEEILERRKRERDERNKWYNRAWRSVTGGNTTP